MTGSLTTRVFTLWSKRTGSQSRDGKGHGISGKGEVVHVKITRMSGVRVR